MVGSDLTAHPTPLPHAATADLSFGSPGDRPGPLGRGGSGASEQHMYSNRAFSGGLEATQVCVGGLLWGWMCAGGPGRGKMAGLLARGGLRLSVLKAL